MKSFELRTTDDGSPAFYSFEFEELSHSQTSSYEETYKYFIEGTNFLELLHKKTPRILEIGFGMGINYSYLLKHSQNKPFEYVGIERNKDFLEYFPSNVQVLLGNAAEEILKLENSFDIIIHDAFSAKKEHELWSLSFLKNLKKTLNHDGILSTYCTHPRVIKTFIEAGWFLEKKEGLPPKKASLRAFSHYKDDSQLREQVKNYLVFE